MGSPKLAATMYRWDDPNAPVLSGTRGSLTALLKACLVDGYNLADTVIANRRNGAGWSLAFIDAEAQTSCFRINPTAGTGKYLRVNEKTTTDAQCPSVQGFEAMTDVDTGLGAFPATELIGLAPQNQTAPIISNSASTSSRPWIVVANDVFVWVIVWPSSGLPAALSIGSSVSVFVFGDFPSFGQDDLHTTLVWRSHNDGLGGSYYDYRKSCGLFTAWTPGFYNSSYNYCVAPIHFCRNAAGEGPTYSRICLVNGGGNVGTGYTGSPFFGESGPAYAPGDPLVTIRHFIDNSDGTLRGYVPGLEVPYAYRPFTPGQFVINEKTNEEYIYIGGTLYADSFGLLINLTNFWRL